MRFGFRKRILPGVRIGSTGVRIGPRAAGIRVGPKSTSITGGVGPLYYTTGPLGKRKRRASKVAAGSATVSGSAESTMGCAQFMVMCAFMAAGAFLLHLTGNGWLTLLGAIVGFVAFACIFHRSPKPVAATEEPTDVR